MRREKEVIFDLLTAIRKDDRHASAILFWDQPIEKRNFQDWAMAFINLNDVNTEELQGFSDFLKEGFSGIKDENLTTALNLLLECKDLLDEKGERRARLFRRGT